MGVKVREKPKGSGEWWIFIDHQNKRKARKIGRDKNLAQKVAKQIEARLVLGKFDMDDKEVPTFGYYAEKWIETVVPFTCKSSTLSDYRAILKNHILPVFNNKFITEINRLLIKEFLVGKLKAGLSESKINHLKSCISGIFELAIDDKMIDLNPTNKLGRLCNKKKQKASKKIDFLTRDELSLLLQTFQKYFPKHYPFVLTLSRTGMRLGEAIGLQWGDIDFNSRFITVQRNITRGKLDTTKNYRARRVDMSLQLTEKLWHLKKERFTEFGDNIPEWIFINSRGNPIDEGNFRGRIFYKTLEIAEIRRIRIHDLRHTYASLLLQNGESMVYVMEQLGHSSIRVTVDTYGHLIPGGNIEAVDKLDDILENATIRNLSATEIKKDLSAIT